MTSVVKFQPHPATKSLVNGLFDELFNRGIADYVGHDAVFSQPSANVLESKDAFKVAIAAPGFDKTHFSVNVEKDQLVITAQRETQNESEAAAERFVRREFRFENFKRSFKLPQTVNQDSIVAVYENGILNVTLPKKEEAKPLVRTIEIG
jgi:HSP20 family protein